MQLSAHMIGERPKEVRLVRVTGVEAEAEMNALIEGGFYPFTMSSQTNVVLFFNARGVSAYKEVRLVALEDEDAQAKCQALLDEGLMPFANTGARGELVVFVRYNEAVFASLGGVCDDPDCPEHGKPKLGLLDS